MAGFVGNIWSMVCARFIQGFGAVSSAMIALSADLTREEVRTRAFAHIGASIGLTSSLVRSADRAIMAEETAPRP